MMNDFESRLNKLERTNRHYRILLTVSLGAWGVFALAGFGGQVQTGPRNIVADSITVQTLNAYTGTVTNLGSNRLTAQYAMCNDLVADSIEAKASRFQDLQGSRAVFGRATANSISVQSGGSPDGVVLAAKEDGGRVSVMNADGRETAVLSATDLGGSFQLAGKNGLPAVEAWGDDKTGRIRIVNSMGKTLASLGRDDQGDGEVVAHTRNGNRVSMLTSNEEGEAGEIRVQSQGGEPRVTLGSDTKGGTVTTLDGAHETARLPAKN